MKRFDEIRNDYSEDLTEASGPEDPPMVLVLRRKSFRQFSGGERVALYKNDKLGIEVSIPYSPGKVGGIKNSAVAAVSEEVIEEGAIHKLHHIAKTKTAGSVAFKNGATSQVEPTTALQVINLHSKVNPENKARIEKLVNSSPAGLTQVAGFASDNLKG